MPSTPTSVEAHGQSTPQVHDDTDYSILEKATKEELIATVKKQRQVALRYKGRFTEVREVSGRYKLIGLKT